MLIFMDFGQAQYLGGDIDEMGCMGGEHKRLDVWVTLAVVQGIHFDRVISGFWLVNSM